MSENLYVVEVVEFKTNKVVSTVGVPGMPERRTEQVERGMNINLDHENYYTRVVLAARSKKEKKS